MCRQKQGKAYSGSARRNSFASKQNFLYRCRVSLISQSGIVIWKTNGGWQKAKSKKQKAKSKKQKAKSKKQKAKSKKFGIFSALGLVAQLVEQRIENPCVGGSIPPRATKNIPSKTPTHAGWRFCLWD
jgi:hypothetical protein